jgi:hypothetical protein
MKKTIGLICFISAVISFASCGMKECRCISANVVMQGDSLINNETDSVSNFTRGVCDEFNKDETHTMDTNITVHHTVLCVEG